ncbi:MAG: hypothetical protein P8013_13025 [Candidatus Sulfobium sp.]
MSLGMTLLEDTVDVFVLDRPVEDSQENIMNMGTMKEMGIKLYTNLEGSSGLEFIPTRDIANLLPVYDHVLPY